MALFHLTPSSSRRPLLALRHRRYAQLLRFCLSRGTTNWKKERSTSCRVLWNSGPTRTSRMAKASSCLCHTGGAASAELHLHRVGDQLELERSTRVDLRPGTGLAARIESIGLCPGPSCCRAMSRSRTQAYASQNTIDPAVLINAQLRGSPCTHLTGRARAAAAVSFSAPAQDGVSRPLPPSRPGSRPSSFASPCLGVLSQ
jgi:hypothetical protein